MVIYGGGEERTSPGGDRGVPRAGWRPWVHRSKTWPGETIVFRGKAVELDGNAAHDRVGDGIPIGGRLIQEHT